MNSFERVSSTTSACLHSTSGDQVPLLGVALRGEVYGAHARIVLRQRYKNRETKPIEAIYTFPIPSDATLVGFAMECAGRRVEAEVQEREAAFAKYDEAISKGHGAALLEQERPNVFTASVGNLLPDEETVVEVVFLQKLTADEGALRLMIPTLVAPRYIPGNAAGDRSGHGSANPTDVVPDADRISPKIANVKYGLSMDVVFDLGRKVTIESPSHSIQAFAESEMRQRVTFSSQIVALDRDIVLVAEGAAGVAAGVVCDKRSGEEGTFALTLVPDLFEAKKASKRRSVVFVVDVSGSMAGESIAQAKRALRLCLRHLSEGDLFDIIPFSTTYSQFSTRTSPGRRNEDLIPFTQTTLNEADRYVDALEANGGTEMLEPLSVATKLLSGMKRDRIIVLLTDGQVGNEKQIVDEIANRATGARIYTFGIGMNVSDLLLRDLAQRTKGAVEFIHPGERIDEKVTAQFARATAARVNDVSVKWVGIDAGEVSPGDPPALVDGEPWSVYGRYEMPGKGHAEIHGLLGGEKFSLEIPIDLVSNANRPALTSLWAGARVRDLVQVDEASLGRRADAHKKRIVDLCVKHGIASKYTSFVVVDKRTGERRAQGQPAARPVPVHAAAVTARRSASAPMKMRSIGLKNRLAAPAKGGSGSVPDGSLRQELSRDLAAAADTELKSAAPIDIAFGSAPAPAPTPMQGTPPMPSPAVMEGGLTRGAMRDDVEEEKAAPMFDRAVGWAKKALGMSKKEESRDEKPLAPAMEERKAEVKASSRKEKTQEDLGSVFARQLASGLWESSDTSIRGQFIATTDVLERCVHEGIDTSHSVYGAQMLKAIEVLSTFAEEWARSGENDKDLILALVVMAALVTGKRARTKLEVIASTATSKSVKSIATHLANQDAAKKKLAEIIK